MSTVMRIIVIFFDAILWMISAGTVLSGVLFLGSGICYTWKALKSKTEIEKKDNYESGIMFSFIGGVALIVAFILIMLSLRIAQGI